MKQVTKEELQVNDYAGKVCPFCKTEFAPTDEIVVCSECDMPHHKECWVENQGCTTFGCMGTIKVADNAATSVTQKQMSFEDNIISDSVVYCTKCGAQHSSSSSFCCKCGNKLVNVFEQERKNSSYTQTNNAEANPNVYDNYRFDRETGIDADIQRLIEIKSDYYIPKFQEIKSHTKKFSWNWATFLVAPYWMIYRKMYGYGAAVLGVAFLFSLVESGFLSSLLLSGYVVLGMFGNNIYMDFLEKKAIQAKSMTEPYKTQFIIKNSGVNKNATIFTIIGYVLLEFILYL